MTHANAAGLTLEAGSILVEGNYIGLGLDGKTAAGNSGDGLVITASSTGNTIGALGTAGRNIISGNVGNGVVIDGSFGNLLTDNYIGTDATGALDRGNGNNGVLVTDGSFGNVLGGTISGEAPGTQPQNFTGARPPQGNVISGNGASGVLLTNGSDGNSLFGNFIGTAASGVKAVGNAGDGVAITNGSNGNTLSGTLINENPFIYYNVISGNGGNGLRVTDSDNTIIQANFLGLASDNKTALGNRLDGLLVNGTSTNTVFGGVIPLGNVDAANGENGVEVADTASQFFTENTFCGLGAFVDYKNLGNHGDGMLITSTGGGIFMRINVISGNRGDGIHIAGDASYVQALENIIGLNTSGATPIPNFGDGIEVGGTAHDVELGGVPPGFSIIQIDTISANRGYGVAFTGAAHDNELNFARIGTNIMGVTALGNAQGGVFVGPGTRSTIIGSTNPSLPTLVSGNKGNGISLVGTSGNAIIGTSIGVSRFGKPLGNAGAGISIVGSSDNQIGGTLAGEADVIAANRRDGVAITSGNHNTILANSIARNKGLGIRLAAGANDNQAAPVLTSGSRSPSEVTLSGRLVSTPNTAFNVELFLNLDGGAANAQGAIFLDAQTVTTDASGVATFTFVEPPRKLGVYTATATSPLGDTSQFSNGRHC